MAFGARDLQDDIKQNCGAQGSLLFAPTSGGGHPDGRACWRARPAVTVNFISVFLYGALNLVLIVICVITHLIIIVIIALMMFKLQSEHTRKILKQEYNHANLIVLIKTC